MATPVTHTVLTAKVYDRFFKDKIKKDFFIGTLIPDIRYLKVIDRSKTHYGNLTLDDLKKDDSFSAGMKFHSILDIVREKFMAANNVYSLCPESKYITQSLKLLEDKIFYQYIKDWDEYVNYLKDILPGEINLGVAKNDIERWHLLLRQYFQQQPDQKAIARLMLGIGYTDEIVHEINNDIETMRANKKIIIILERLYKDFDTIII